MAHPTAPAFAVPVLVSWIAQAPAEVKQVSTLALTKAVDPRFPTWFPGEVTTLARELASAWELAELPEK